MIEDKAITYLSRLTGVSVTKDQAVKLNSLQVAAFSAWLRKESAPNISLELIATQFTVDRLFASSAAEPITHAVSREPTIPAVFVGEVRGIVLGIGIDIENCKALPETGDYRVHEFYTANFSPAEIAYCILQSSARTSLAGLWAAKEAIVKSGAAQLSTGALRDIEILHDDFGRPFFAGCFLSISHTDEVAIAVAIWQGPIPSGSSSQANNSELMNENIEDAGKKNRLSRKTISIALAVLAFLSAPLVWWMNNHS